MQTIEQALRRLSSSSFRARFHLDAGDKAYVRERGMAEIRRHGADFIAARLAPALPKNDGRQTPMRGHPIFKAQHACACCCRGCMEKWYRVPKGRPLTPGEQERILNLLMAWIAREMEDNPAEKTPPKTE